MKPRILVVDDEEKIQKTMVEFLNYRLNADVRGCINSTEAMALMDQEKFDVLIQDLQMPNIDGLTVIVHGKKSNPNLVALLMTRLSEQEKISQVEKAGAIYIPKPFEMKMIVKIIERELSKLGGFEFSKD
ncbi:MAG: response regulator [Candidatus Omnitrophota bacterium]